MTPDQSSGSAHSISNEHNDLPVLTTQHLQPDIPVLSQSHSLMPPTVDRPSLKRRKTTPDPTHAHVTDSPTPASASRDDSPAADAHDDGPAFNGRKGNGKDGQDVWPVEVEDAFHAALRIVPKLGRKKVLVRGKPCGRNELVAEYIRRLTGQLRSRKQVSSHIQVLKNLRKNDKLFMELVSEPTDGEESFDLPTAITFFGNEDEANAMMAGTTIERKEDGLDSAQLTEKRQTIHRSTSSATRPSPATAKVNVEVVATPTPAGRSVLQESFVLGIPPKSSGMAQPPLSASTSSLELALDKMHLPPLPSPSPMSCPIAPVGFCLWADDLDDSTDQSHIFARIDSSAGPGPCGTTQFEDLSLCKMRYPDISAMRDHLSCPFMHLQVNLNIPERINGNFPTQLHTQLKLSAASDLSLTAVTSIYSFGTKVISLEEDLGPASRISPLSRSVGGLAPSLNSSPASPMSPITPGMGRSTWPLAKHKYSYSSGFAPHFWQQFLMGNYSATQPAHEQPPPSLCKSGQERADVAMAIAGLSVVQEFVVRAETDPLTEGTEVSPGSSLGEVVLVVTFDFEARDNWTAGRAKLTYLAVKSGPAVSGLIGLLSTSFDDDDLFPPLPPLDYSSDRVHLGAEHSFPPQSSFASSHPNPRRPSLTIHVPPPFNFRRDHYGYPGATDDFSAGGAELTTPWPQLGHTPTCPPPMAPPAASAAQQHRLQQMWAAHPQADWDKNSPVLLGAFPHELTGYTSVGQGHGPGQARRGSLAMAEMTGQAMAAGNATYSDQDQGAHGPPFGQPIQGVAPEEFNREDCLVERESEESSSEEVYFDRVEPEEAVFRRHSDAMRAHPGQDGYTFGSGGRY